MQTLTVDEVALASGGSALGCIVEIGGGILMVAGGCAAAAETAGLASVPGYGAAVVGVGMIVDGARGLAAK